MKRPYTVCHILSALDGKITGPFMGTEAVGAVSEEYACIRSEYQADAWLYGTVTTKEFTGGRKPELDPAAEVPDGDFVADNHAQLYYVSVDTQGEIFTEQADLEAVVHMMQEQPFVDEENIFIMGTKEPETTETVETDANGGNVLIAYFSLTGNTEEVAQKIAEYTGGTLAEIQRVEEYGDLQEEAEVEILDGVHPEITVSVDSIEGYDTIFVGYPIWWDEAPAMIATFLAENDFSGKTIIPFCTSSSDDIGNSLHIFSELCPDAEIAEGLTANDLNDVEPWIQRLELME